MPGAEIEMRGAVVAFRAARALDGVDLAVPAGSAHGVVGESGSGKTTLCRVLLGLQGLAAGTARVGRITLPPATAGARTELGRAVGWVPQDAVGALDPCMPIGRSIIEGPRILGSDRSPDPDALVLDLASRVGLPPDSLARRPRELSGGQCQRACIARAIATSPGVLIADEPTSSLDPTVQARILDLLADIRAGSGLTLLLVTHTMPLVRLLCDTVTVLRAGRVVESGPVGEVFVRPRDPYTRSLIEAR